jgi:hypothetical protein
LTIGFGAGDFTDEAGRAVVDLVWLGSGDITLDGFDFVGVVIGGGEGVEGLSSVGLLERSGSGGIGIGFSFSRGDIEEDESDSLPGPGMGAARDVAEIPTLFGGHSRRSLISS